MYYLCFIYCFSFEINACKLRKSFKSWLCRQSFSKFIGVSHTIAVSIIMGYYLVLASLSITHSYCLRTLNFVLSLKKKVDHRFWKASTRAWRMKLSFAPPCVRYARRPFEYSDRTGPLSASSRYLVVSSMRSHADANS